MGKDKEIKAGSWWINKRSKQVWELNFVYDDGSDEVVMVKSAGKPLTKIISTKSLLKNWTKKKMYEKVKLYEEFINEREDGHQYDDVSGDLLNPKKGKWIQINPRQYPELSGEFFDLINIAYSSVGGHIKIQSPDDVFADPDWTFWKGVDIHGSPDLDLIVWGQHTKYGIKYSGVGHDGEKDSTREYLNNKAKSLLKKGFYGEVSGVLADIMMDKYGVPSIDNKEDVEKLLKGKDIEWHGKDPRNPNRSGEGWYTRNLGGNRHTKIIIGKPKV